jgi:hypothetical protein
MMAVLRRLMGMVVAGLMVGLGACSPSTGGIVQAAPGGIFAGEQVDPAAVKLGDAVLAFYVSAWSPVNPKDGGYVVLVNRAGDVRMIRTSGMDLGLLVWDEHGLFFADQDNDYLLTADGLQVTARPKADYQIALFAIDGKHVALYNDGFARNGYTESVIVSAGATSRRVKVPGAYWKVANCGGVWPIHRCRGRWCFAARAMRPGTRRRFTSFCWKARCCSRCCGCTPAVRAAPGRSAVRF